MRKILAVAVVTQAALWSSPAASSGVVQRARHAEWQIVRTDYREFCAPNVAAIDLNHGSLNGSIGACDPRRNGSARQIEAVAASSDISALRKLAARLNNGVLVDASCASSGKMTPKAPIVLPGPVMVTIERGRENVIVDTRSQCLTGAGRNLLALIDRAIEPLRAQGLR